MNFIVKLWRKFFPEKPTISFKCFEGGAYFHNPVQEARRVIPYWLKKQIAAKNNQFGRCPGMFDQTQAGYIITAHADIHIKANKQGAIIKIDNIPESLSAVNMSYPLVEGMAPIKDSVAKQVFKVPLPWGVFTKKGYSAQILPATMHSSFLDKLYVYPGVVDYENFHTVNLIFSVLEECEFTIWAGDPILQVIPFKRENYIAEVKKATGEEIDRCKFAMPSRKEGTYRRVFHKRKTYLIKKNDNILPL